MFFDNKRLIIFELNEVPLKVFDWFLKSRPRSYIARLMTLGTVLETYTEDKGHLSPWITWPTLHRGVINTEHAIYDFGQNLTAVNADFPPFWDLMTKTGRTVGLFGSLHTYPVPHDLTNYAFYVPDTFAAGPECFPSRLTAFQEFNLRMVDQSARNVSRNLPIREAAKFLASAPGLGLRGATALKLARQLGAERVNPKRVVRRRTSQVQIAFDFFLNDLRRTRPEIAMFFTNHVASSMHRFWPATFPEDYSKPFWDETWASKWNGEIPFAMGEADLQIRDLMKFVESDQRYALVVVTSMGQAAVNDVASLVRTQLNFADLRAFMRLLGIPDDQWRRERAMVPIYMVNVAPRFTDVFTDRLRQVYINGESLSVMLRGEGVFHIKLGQPNLDTKSIKVTYMGRPVTLLEAGMTNLDIQDEADSNAYHIPQGSLIYYNPSARSLRAARRSVSTLEFAPAVLRNFAVELPSHMARPQILR